MSRNRSATDAEPKPSRTKAIKPSGGGPSRSFGVRLADGLLIVAFLALTFLLGCFPLKDTDFWWHLRTGDLIRQGAGLPVTDWYTFAAEGHPWIDLHWLFQVLLSLGYEAGGVVGLNLAKCVVTCAAVLLLILPPRREWPVWVMVLVWLPALFLLGGRMYIRPETLTLFYLAAFLAVLVRWDETPRLAYLLPIIQVLWVNTQGLFILGPIVLGCALVDGALRPGAFGPTRWPWWRTVGIATLLTIAACVINPYGLRGATFPLQIAQTMADPIFSRSIGELKPVLALSPSDPPSFIDEMGFRSLPLQFHLATLTLGALSFLLPIFWRASVRLRTGAEGAIGSSVDPPTGKRKRKKRPAAPSREVSWRLRPFRVLLFVAFSLLSFKATRNSHQFAAVVGAVTAWNFGEWAAALRARRPEEGDRRHRAGILPRLTAMACLVLAFAAVASGQVYTWAGEGRTIGLGQEPLWYPHEATQFAGSEGMPERFVCFHNGHSALYAYYHGPERKVFTDARLEVMGPELYARYLDLSRRIEGNQPGWEDEIADMGQPGILVDNVLNQHAGTTATLMAHPRWRCVWFDPIASVFVRDTDPPARHPVDFAARHFRPEPKAGPGTIAESLASSKALYDVAFQLVARGQIELARPMIVLALNHAGRVLALDPESPIARKQAGLLEAIREPIQADQTTPRFRMPFDPVFDLSPARATYLLETARARLPEDPKVLYSLALLYHGRGMFEAALPLEQRIARLDPPNQRIAATRMLQQEGLRMAALSTAELGAEPQHHWRNLDELGRLIDTLLRTGRAESAAATLERAYPLAARPWEITDRIATIRLHLGQPDRARDAWRAALGIAPRPALVSARIGATHYIEGDLTAARTAYERALATEPDLFEALYGLAVVELDHGRATETAIAAREAETRAPNDVAAASARAMVVLAAPFAAPASETEIRPPRPVGGRGDESRGEVGE